MRTFTAFASLLGIALPLTAIAQPPPPPPPPPSGGGYVAPAPVEPSMRVDVGLSANIAGGDFENVDTSPGFNATLGVTVAPRISVFGGLRFIAIQPEGGDGDFSQFDISAGGRYAAPVSPTAKLFGEAFLALTTLSFDTIDGSESESGLGFGIRVGGVFAVSGNIGIGGAVSYTTASVDLGGFDVDAAWTALEGFVSFGF